MTLLPTRISFFMAVFLLNGNAVHADMSCKLSSNYFYAQPEAEYELLIREGEFAIEAILITNFGTQVFNCANIDECYGFAPRPGQTPVQLNFFGDGIQSGTTVNVTALNLFFLRQFAQDDYEDIDLETRRFSIDSYTIESCEDT